jgi:hypothetical protein
MLRNKIGRLWLILVHFVTLSMFPHLCLLL